MKLKRMYLYLAIVVIVLLASCVLFFVLNKSISTVDDQKLFEDENAVNIGDGQPFADDASVPNAISIPGFEKMTISSGTTTVNSNIFNPSNNKCYFVAVIALEDGREIYRSGLIAPGKAVYNLVLSEALGAGSYNATLTYFCYALDDERTELNGATTHFILEVTS